MTPLQKVVRQLLDDHESRHGRRPSGRELGERIGKSRNHLSQILNDGLVPSGEVLLRLAEALEADEAQTREMVLAAMRTKIGERARDAFWLERALEMTDRLFERIGRYESFLEAHAMRDAFDSWPGESGEETPPETARGEEAG